MRPLFRVLRGAIGVAAAFGILWALAGVMFMVVVAVFDPASWCDAKCMTRDALAILQIFVIGGVAIGALFSLVLSRTARGQSVENLRTPEVATAGAVAGAVCFAIVLFFSSNNGHRDGPPVLVLLAIGALLGAATAGLVLRLARVTT